MAANIPKGLSGYLNLVALDARRPAFVRVSPEGQVIEAGGELARYGLGELPTGSAIEDAAPFLTGLLPLAGRSATLRWVECAPGVAADVHLVAEEAHDWVLLLDATEEVQARQAMQQRGNEITLERDGLARRVRELEAEIERLRGGR